jgi:hypothetical protein
MLVRIDTNPDQPRVTFTTGRGVIVDMPATIVASADGVTELDVPTLESISFVDETTHVGGAA